MASLNKIQIIGYLGKDPIVKQFQTGAICNFSVSTDESYTDRNGNRVEQTEWHNVVVNGKSADFCSKYLHKGSLVYIEGKCRTRKYQSDGQEKYITEIRADRVQILDRKGTTGPKSNDQQYESAFPSEASNMQDIPF